MDRPARSGTKNPTDENIRAVASLERAALLKRSNVARLADAVMGLLSSELSVALHLIWFVVWMLLNGARWFGVAFDPYPFSLLTLVVSLEAICVSLFVLHSQNRLTKQSEQRGHLDLQINLLAEQEMTVVLRMLRELCDHFNLAQTTQSEEFRALIARTDIGDLAERVERHLEAKKREGP